MLQYVKIMGGIQLCQISIASYSNANLSGGVLFAVTFSYTSDHTLRTLLENLLLAISTGIAKGKEFFSPLRFQSKQHKKP